MKNRFLIAAGVVLAAIMAVAIALGIFITTFDLDRYRPMVVTQLEALLRKPIELEKISLGWRGGISLEIRNLLIYPSDQQTLRPLVQVNAAGVKVPFRVLRNLSLAEEIPFSGTVALFGHTPNIHFEGQTLLVPGGKGISQLQADLRVEDLLLESVFPSAGGHQPQVRGKLSGSFQCFLEGSSTQEIAQRFSGGGEFHLTEGAVVNLNILREVFRRIRVIPELAQTIAAGLPESYREKFEARDTWVEPIDLTVTVGNGRLSLANLRVTTDAFELTGSAQMDLDGRLDFPAQVRVEQQLSAAVIRSVEELRGLANARGELELPVLIQGKLPQVTVMPDVGYVASRLITTTAEDLLGNLLERALEKK